MAIVTFTKNEVQDLDIRRFNVPRSKYPWDNIEVGGLFFVPREMMNREDYRPTAPERLRQQGQKWTAYQGVCPKTNAKGCFVERLA